MRGSIGQFRVRTLLIVVMLVAVALAASRAALRGYRAERYRRDIPVWVEARDRHLRAAELLRSRGDTARAAKRERLAAYSEAWRRVTERAAVSGALIHLSDGPPVPK